MGLCCLLSIWEVNIDESKQIGQSMKLTRPWGRQNHVTPLDKCPLMVPPVVHFPLTLFPVDIDGHIIDTFHINVLKDQQILVVFFLEILLNAVLFLHIVKTLSGSCCFSSFYSWCFIFILMFHWIFSPMFQLWLFKLTQKVFDLWTITQ